MPPAASATCCAMPAWPAAGYEVEMWRLLAAQLDPPRVENSPGGYAFK